MNNLAGKMTKIFILISISVLLVSQLFAQRRQGDYVPGEIIVKFKHGIVQLPAGKR